MAGRFENPRGQVGLSRVPFRARNRATLHLATVRLVPRFLFLPARFESRGTREQGQMDTLGTSATGKRQACGNCGCHTYGYECGNCGSRELVAVEVIERTRVLNGTAGQVLRDPFGMKPPPR